MKKTTGIAILILVAGLMSGCAGKVNRYFVGECGMPGHWFCGKVYDNRADCNNDRKRHDFQTSTAGTCYAGRSDGRPDLRTM